MKKLVALIGMPGSGKSTIGREAARLSGRPFVDLDDLITEKFGPIPKLFESGEPHFRQCEEAALRAALAMDGAVLATGGGIVTQPRCMAVLREHAKVLFLDRPLDRIVMDIDMASRPLLVCGVEALATMAKTRTLLYRQYADAIIPNEGTPEEACARILQAMEEDEQ